MITDVDSAPIIIGLSKKKIILLLIGSWILIAASVWLWQIADSQMRFDSALFKVVSVLGILFFGLCGVYGSKKIFDKEPGLIIDDIGIRDNSSAAGLPLIRWENIDGFGIGEVHQTKFLLVMVNNADELIAQHTGWKRKLISMNKAVYDTPVTISSNSLRCNFDELVQIVSDRFQAVKSRG